MHHSDLILSYVCELCAPWPKNEDLPHLRVGLLPHEVAKLFELLGILTMLKRSRFNTVTRAPSFKMSI